MARSQHLAISGEQAVSVIGPHGLRGAVRRGALVRLWRNAYAVPDWWGAPPAERGSGGAAALWSPPSVDGLGRRASEHDAVVPVWTRLAAAELTLGRTAVACWHTAAELYGFGIDTDHVTHLIGDRSTALKGVTVHRTPASAPLQRAGRFRVVDGAETAIRLAAHAPHPARGLALLDAALRSGFVVPAALSEMAAKLHVDGVGTVRRLVPLADARAESPPESWLRWLCHDAGLPVPQPQFWVRCSDGSSYRLDLAWPRVKLALEYDGVAFHTGAALHRDRARLNALTSDGWTVLAVTAPMLTTGRTTLVAQISDQLRRAGALDR